MVYGNENEILRGVWGRKRQIDRPTGGVIEKKAQKTVPSPTPPHPCRPALVLHSLSRCSERDPTACKGCQGLCSSLGAAGDKLLWLSVGHIPLQSLSVPICKRGVLNPLVNFIFFFSFKAWT